MHSSFRFGSELQSSFVARRRPCPRFSTSPTSPTGLPAPAAPARTLPRGRANLHRGAERELDMTSVMPAVPRVQRDRLVERHAARAPGARRPCANSVRRQRRAGTRPSGGAATRAARATSRPGPLFASGSSAHCASSYALIAGVVLGDRELHPDVRVHVAVGHVVHDLAHGPAVGTIRRVELALRPPVRRARGSCAGACSMVSMCARRASASSGAVNRSKRPTG